MDMYSTYTYIIIMVYIHPPQQVFEHEDVTVLWNHADTQTVVTAKRPDIIIKKQEEKKAHVLIDMAIPAQRNVTQKAAEKD
jgi:hypothetical protein